MKKAFFAFIPVIGFIMLFACGTSVAAQSPFQVDPLDAAIREASNYLNGKITKGNKTVFLNITSNYPDLSEYILSLLSENAVNDKNFSVVDRKQIESIRAELSFQMSGDVDDNSAQSIGKMLGAQSIVSGSVSKIGSLYRLEVKAIEVQTAEIKGQWSKNFPSGSPTIAALTETQSVPAKIGSSTTTSTTQNAPVTPLNPVAYKIGDKGPGGGIIFYVNTTGFTLTADGTICHYLEAAATDMGIMAWASSESLTTNITGTAVAVGSGKRNTDLILATDSNSPAANACKNYSSGGKNDWFLPSVGELTQLYHNRDIVGNFNTSYFDSQYWSSSQDSRSESLHITFRNGEQVSYGGKGAKYKVRPIRAF
jgi:TolB-like protein